MARELRDELPFCGSAGRMLCDAAPYHVRDEHSSERPPQARAAVPQQPTYSDRAELACRGCGLPGEQYRDLRACVDALRSAFADATERPLKARRAHR